MDRGMCVCLPALSHPSLHNLTEMRWQAFDVRKRFSSIQIILVAQSVKRRALKMKMSGLFVVRT